MKQDPADGAPRNAAVNLREIGNSRRPEGRRLKSPLGDDGAAGASLLGIDGDGFVGDEVQIALDGEAELAANGGEFDEAHVAKLLGPSLALALRARLRRFKTAPAVLVRLAHA